MNPDPRTLYANLWEELSASKNMVFMAGPRQAGKTTLTHIISRSFVNNHYFNYDIIDHRKRFLENPTFFREMDRKDPSQPLIVLDEIHKYKDWKNYLKKKNLSKKQTDEAQKRIKSIEKYDKLLIESHRKMAKYERGAMSYRILYPNKSVHDLYPTLSATFYGKVCQDNDGEYIKMIETYGNKEHVTELK